MAMAVLGEIFLGRFMSLIKTQQSKSGNIENALDQNWPGKEQAENSSDTSGDWDERISKGMFPNREFHAAAFRQNGSDIILADLIKHRIFLQEREKGEITNHVAKHREKHVMNLIFDLAPERELIEIIGSESSDRKEIEKLIAGSAKQRFQNHSERKSRDGIQSQNDETGGSIKGGSVS